MRWMMFLCLFAITASLSADEPKGVVVKLDRLSATTPPEWKVQKPANRLRSHQFLLPKVDADKVDAELVIAPDIRGTYESNLQRWKESFIPPEGKTLDEVAKVEKFKVGKAEVVYLDVQGSQIYKERPFDPKSKEVIRPGFRMLSVIFDSGEGNYRIYLQGPSATVEKYKPGFDAWLKAFR